MDIVDVVRGLYDLVAIDDDVMREGAEVKELGASDDAEAAHSKRVTITERAREEVTSE